MKLMEDKILREGVVCKGDVLKVGSFLNQQMDIGLYREIGREFARLFSDCGVNKVLTIEASGIAIAVVTAEALGCDAVFAKKSKTSNLSGDLLVSKAHSYTHNTDNTVVLDRRFLTSADKVLIVDDFLASGEAFGALVDLCNQAGAAIAGVGCAIEKKYQGGGDNLRAKGIRVESLARIVSMDEKDGIKFG